ESQEIREQCSNRFRIPRESDGDVERDSETALRTNERADQVVSAVLTLCIADLNDLAIGQQNGERYDMVRRDAVFETVRAAGIFGDVPADGARGLTRR